ncbi:hypothetical protein LX87_05236 [Larkinella arboricola]|uniref:Uncharacterized protein n=1 Tax=Larkinella arboricola TaxID=643671 RepID=A0A327WNX0_LARAB|nr:hypothetical protein LX87_05236 [Larkinella arboricola]
MMTGRYAALPTICLPKVLARFYDIPRKMPRMGLKSGMSTVIEALLALTQKQIFKV